jgi:hypothetical protein
MAGVFVCQGAGYLQVDSEASDVESSIVGDDSDLALTACEPCKAFQLCDGACRHTFYCGCFDYTICFTCKHILAVSFKQGNWSPTSVFTNCLQKNATGLTDGIHSTERDSESMSSADAEVPTSTDQHDNVSRAMVSVSNSQLVRFWGDKQKCINLLLGDL